MQNQYGPNKFNKKRSEIAFWIDIIQRKDTFFNSKKAQSNKQSDSKFGRGEGDEFNKSLFMMMGLSGSDIERKSYEEAFQTLDKWQFDAFSFIQITKEFGFTYFTMRLIGKYMTFKSVNVDSNTYCRMLQKLSYGYNSKQFYSEVHIIDSLQAAHYFLTECGLKQHFSDMQIFILFTVICMHDFQHPYCI